MSHALPPYLTPPQRDAILHHGSPLLIIAGPGSGKTEVIAWRIAHLIQSGSVKPENILALTFTNKASLSLKDRIQSKVPGADVENMEVSTFHAFCANLLRQHTRQSPLPHGYQILDATGQFLFVYSRRKKLGLDALTKGLPGMFYDSVIATFNRATEEQVSPDAFDGWCQQNLQTCCGNDTGLWQECAAIAEAYRRYCALLVEEDRVDFAFLQTHALNLLRQNPDVIAGLRGRYCEILADEYQDTNAAQESVLQLLAGDGEHLTVVGDDDQSIYRFRGATVKNILEFEEHYANTKVVKLMDNFRSHDQIIGQSQNVIQHNPARFDKHLLSMRGPGSEIILIYEHTAAAEAGKVVEILKRLHESGKIASWSDVAVLLRSVKSYAKPYREALVSAGIPFQVTGDASFFDRDEISQVYNLLHFLGASKPWGDQYLRSPIVGLSRETHEALRTYKDNLLEIATAEGLANIGIINAADRRRLLDLLRLKQRVQAQQQTSILEVFYGLISVTGLAARLEQEGNTEALSNLGILSQLMAAWDENGATQNFYPFQEYLKLVKEGGVDPYQESRGDALQIITIHQSKGLEFPVVVLGAAMNGRLPSCLRKEPYQIPYHLRASGLPEVADPHLVDERKLYYVASTRARDLLIVGTADLVEKRGGGPSPFVKEMFGADLKTAATWSLEKVTEIESRAQAGSRVRPRHSFSELAIYLECPVRYKYAHVYGLAIPRLDPVQYGANVHLALQTLHERAMSGNIPKEEEIPTIVDETWVSAPPGRGASEENLKHTAIVTLQKYLCDAHAGLDRIAKVEAPFSFTLSGQVLSGKVDLCRKSGSALELVDFKTSTPYPGALERDEFQLALYGLGVEEGMGYPVSELTVQFLGKEPKHVSWEWNPDRRQKALERLTQMLDCIARSDYLPNLAFCSHCREYRDICPYPDNGGSAHEAL